MSNKKSKPSRPTVPTDKLEPIVLPEGGDFTTAAETLHAGSGLVSENAMVTVDPLHVLKRALATLKKAPYGVAAADLPKMTLTIEQVAGGDMLPQPWRAMVKVGDHQFMARRENPESALEAVHKLLEDAYK